MRLTARQQLEFGEKWVDENPDAWLFLKMRVAFAKAEGHRQPFRLAYFVEGLRANGMSFANDANAYVSRRLERELCVQFTKSKSKIDLLLKDSE